MTTSSFTWHENEQDKIGEAKFTVDWMTIDASGLLRDAVAAMSVAGARHVDEGHAIRLSGPGMQAVRGVLADYREALHTLPARVMVETHRLTEQRVHELLQGRGRPGDVQIVERAK